MSRLTNLWTLGEGTGSSIADLSGNGGDGTLYDSPAWISGVASNALRLQLAKTYDISGFPAIISLSRVDTGRWNHFAFTFDGTTARAWLNGACEATGSWTNGVGYANFELTLAQYCGSPADWFDGQLDEVRVYGTALSPAELRTLAAAHDYSYDAKGNLTGDRVWGYEYDRENRLAVATDGAVRIDYRYDPFGRLIERRTSGSSASTNRMYYAGWQLIAEYDGGGNLDRKYVYGPGIDEPVLIASGGTNYFYHADGLGSVTEITDSTGATLETYTYDVYGAPTIRDAGGATLAASAIGNRLMFTARDRDPETELYNYRYRYYSPGLGRFVQPDPIEQAMRALQPALYHYAHNNPVNRVDPLGLFDQTACTQCMQDALNDLILCLFQALGQGILASLVTGVVGAIVGGAFGGFISGGFVLGLITGFVGGTVVGAIPCVSSFLASYSACQLGPCAPLPPPSPPQDGSCGSSG